jgi:hypothetical protein
MTACPYATTRLSMEGWIFIKFYISEFFEKSVEKIKVSLKSDTNNGHFT